MSRFSFAVLLSLACSTPPSLGLTAPDVIPLVVENNTNTDFVAYLVSSGGARQRMGLVTANRIARFPLSISLLREAPRVLIRQIADGEWMTDALHPVMRGTSIRLEVSGLGGIYGFLSYR